MDVTKSLQAGRNLVAAWVKNVGDSPNPAGLVGVLRVEFEIRQPDRHCDRCTMAAHSTATWIGGRCWKATTARGVTRK